MAGTRISPAQPGLFHLWRHVLRIFIGYDERESIAATVLAHSIQERASCPVSITRIDTRQLPFYKRPDDPLASTAFTYARFLVPYLCNYQGTAVFMDCDMLCLGDVAGFLAYPEPGKAVSVVKHNYQPQNATKFLGAAQTRYPKKLWSALMVFDCSQCKALTPEYVNTATGAELHQFKWLDESLIGDLPGSWQWIPDHSDGDPRLLHWTEGGPWFPEYRSAPYAAAWLDELTRMTQYEAA